MCSWNLDSIKGYYVSARKGSNVVVEFNLNAGRSRICPDMTVIQSVTFGSLQVCPRGVAAGQYAPLRAATAQQRLNIQTCARVQGQGNTLSYAFKVNSPANSRGRCARVEVETSDGVLQIMLLRYIN
jgi:hypothetical protein